MRLLKRTYALPTDTLEAFEKVTAPGKRSAMVAALMTEWLDRQRREQLRRDIVEGCHEMAEVYLDIEKEYHPLEEEVEHASREHKTRRHRSRPS